MTFLQSHNYAFHKTSCVAGFDAMAGKLHQVLNFHPCTDSAYAFIGDGSCKELWKKDLGCCKVKLKEEGCRPLRTKVMTRLTFSW